MIKELFVKYINQENIKNKTEFDFKKIPIVVTTVDDISYAPSFYEDENEKYFSFFLKTNEGEYLKIIPKQDIKIIEVVYSNEGDLIDGTKIMEILTEQPIENEDTVKMYG